MRTDESKRIPLLRRFPPQIPVGQRTGLPDNRRVRKISPPVLPIPPATTSIRTRIKDLSERDVTVLKVVGRHLGSLASLDLAERIRPGDAHDRHGWADRKRRLTPECSSRWAGSITKASNEAYALARRNRG